MDSSSSSSFIIDEFEHDELPDAARHLRLLEVVEDNYSDTTKVRCRMTTWPIDSLPSYYAISYTWGHPKANKLILINEKHFEVRKNCEFALKQAHWSAKSRYYWIDAICIDQQNLSEKSKQVAIMGNIFKRAAHVLACVGDHSGDSRFLCRNLERFSRTLRGSRPEGSPVVWTEENEKNLFSRLYRKHGFFTTRRFLRASTTFVKRPYFTRLWVLQELKNAKQATLLCGAGSMSKDEFEYILMWLLYHRSKIILNPVWKLFPFLSRKDEMWENTFLQNIPRRQSEKWLFAIRIWDLLKKDLDPLEVVHTTIRLECTIRKDKVYGILSLIGSGDDAIVIPDYSKSNFEVALDLLRAFWATEVIQKKDYEPKLFNLCLDTMMTLGLNVGSYGVAEALEARNGSPKSSLNGTKTWLRDPLPLARSRAMGWRISAEHLVRDCARLKYWKPPGATETRVYLPYWTKAGDWVLIFQEPHVGKLMVVLREEADSLCMPIVGQGWCTYGAVKLDATAFDIHWNPEDALIFFSLYCLLRPSEVRSSTWLRALNHSVCRLETPGSSYGVRLQQNEGARETGPVV